MICHLHLVSNLVPICQDLRQRFLAKKVTQRRLRQKMRRPGRVFDVNNRHHRIEDAKVNNGVHRDRHRIFRQYLYVRCRCSLTAFIQYDITYYIRLYKYV